MSNADKLRGRICLVTGANSGIGKATALGLAKLGSTVVMVCRDRARGEAAQADIKRESGNDAVDLMIADLSSLAAVRELTAQITAKYPKLDVLINNAAVYKPTRTMTVDGFETMFATNHLAPFLLSNLLLESLHASRLARVLNITAPSTVRLDFDDLQGERRFNALTAFGASKMCNLLFTFELARRLEGRSVAVNAVHPGLAKSNLTREFPALMRWFTYLISAPPERAAEGIVRLASASEFAGRSGRFYHNGTEIIANEYARDPNVQRRLWEVSAELTKLSN
jgi:NAD(P)-dependent dehydrogenase (short-subunit alcohol dehydrogenase family)